MAKRTGTMTELLRAALAEGRESLNAIQRATGIKRQSLATFLRGESTLRLDAADKLAAHFGIVIRPGRRPEGARRKAGDKWQRS
jgi:plasmid maintenance system antidote protein VapI